MSRLLTEQLVQSIIQQLAYRLPLVGGYFSVNFSDTFCFAFFSACCSRALLSNVILGCSRLPLISSGNTPIPADRSTLFQAVTGS